MKEYFSRLFGYDQYANQIIAAAIINAGNPEKSVLLMAHLLAAQQVWLNRCMLLPQATGPLWPETPANELTGKIGENGKQLLGFIGSLQPEDFEKMISYKNLQGVDFTNRLSDMLMQLINHGTHHRAQIGQYLKTGKVPLPVTDYIFYIRQLNG